MERSRRQIGDARAGQCFSPGTLKRVANDTGKRTASLEPLFFLPLAFPLLLSFLSRLFVCVEWKFQPREKLTRARASFLFWKRVYGRENVRITIARTGFVIVILAT